MAGSRLPDLTAAAVTALVNDATLTTALGGTKVYSHVPEDTSPPYVLVLGGREVPWARGFGLAGADDERDCEVLATVVSSYRGSKELDDLASRILTVWTLDTPWAAVTGYAGVLFAENQRPMMELVNGVIYYQRTLAVRVFLT